MLLEDQLMKLLFENTCAQYQRIRDVVNQASKIKPLRIMHADDAEITPETYFRMNNLHLRIGERIQEHDYNLHKDGSLSVIVVHENLGRFIGNGTLNFTVTDRKGERPYISEFETQFPCRSSLNELNPKICDIEINIPTNSRYCVEEYEDEYGPLYRIRTKRETMEIVADVSTESAGHILHTHNLHKPLNSTDAIKALQIFKSFAEAYKLAAN